MFVKICCIKSVAEARLAIFAGASAIGLVSDMPSGPGVISEDLIAEIARAIPPTVSSFLLTQQQTANAIIQQHRICKTTAIQMVDAVPINELHELRRALPEVKLVQVFHVVDAASVIAAQQVAPFVDALILDSGQPTAANKMLGGTGRTHDWGLSREICESSPAPVFLAGGISAYNVAQAVAAVNPFGVDACSSVRTEDVLDEAKLHAFFAAARQIDSVKKTHSF